MKRLLLAICLCLSSTAFAEEKKPDAAAGMPDMTKMGPGTRKVQHEAEDKKAIEAMLKASEAAMEKSDLEAAADLIDFPVVMTSDSPSTGEAASVEMTREQWIATMKPFAGPMPPGSKFSMKNDIAVLTDSLATVVSNCSMTMGKMTMKWKSSDLVVRKKGKWLVKAMTEGGWGDMPVPSAEQAKK